ncbi:MAG TPA: hypothetical protein VN836_07180 [Verrucomicrobiae bacterium]|nr:hypothetical protein [Verrucomicrobiae bacterium]
MHAHFRDYNTAYADALNEQMLLNLARLENGHPAYYLAIGAIDDRLSVSGSAGVGNTGTFTDSKTAPTGGAITRVFQSVFGYNASGTITRTINPEFQFIPLNNEAVAKQVLQPISTDVFFTLYQQGYPIDQLMRVLIERVETTLPNNQELVLVNSPTRGTPESYGKYLRACAILRELQQRGYLSLRAVTQPPENMGPVSFNAGSGAKAGGQPGAGGRNASQPENPEQGSGGNSAPGEKGSPSLKDYADAQDKGWTLTQTNGTWQLGLRREMPIFVLNTDVVAVVQSPAVSNPAGNQIVSEGNRRLVQSGVNFSLAPAQLALVPAIVQSLTNANFNATNSKSQEVIADDTMAVLTVIGLLNEGISVQTKVSGEAQARTRLVLRSFGRAMEAVASEQPAFDTLVLTNHQFRSVVPNSEQHPVIRIEWSHVKEPLQPPLRTIRYADRNYEITDPVADALDPNVSWNRDIFRLLVALNSQVTVDISKFQQQVFELRTD